MNSNALVHLKKRDGWIIIIRGKKNSACSLKVMGIASKRSPIFSQFKPPSQMLVLMHVYRFRLSVQYCKKFCVLACGLLSIRFVCGKKNKMNKKKNKKRKKNI